MFCWSWNVDSLSSLGGKKDGADKGGLSPNATSYAPSHVSVKDNEKVNPSGDLVEGSITGKAHGQTQNVNSHGRPGSSASCSSDCAAAASASSGPGLSPSSSMGSLSSEKSTLNPHAKVWLILPFFPCREMLSCQVVFSYINDISGYSFFPLSLSRSPFLTFFRNSNLIRMRRFLFLLKLLLGLLPQCLIVPIIFHLLYRRCPPCPLVLE